ncbi:MAG: methyl-accepting chemotaxis protein, partial [Myxococcota bacterium]
MRFSIRLKLIALVVSTVVVTAVLASTLAFSLLGIAVQDSLSRRSLVVAEALGASSEIQLLVVERSTGTESRIGPSVSNTNAVGFLRQLVQADEELDYVILVSQAGESLIEVVAYPEDLRFGALDLRDDRARLEFVKQTLAGRGPPEDGRMAVSTPLFGTTNRKLPSTQAILGFDSSVQLERYNQVLVLSYLQLGVALLGLLLLFFIRFERRVGLIGAYANEIASGKLNVVPPDVGNDELGDIVRELSSIRVGLGSTVNGISTAADEVEAISLDVSEASKRIAGDAGTQALSLQSASSAMSALATSSSTVDSTVRDLIAIADSSFGKLRDLVSEVEAIGSAVDELTAAVDQVQRFFDESERGLVQAERASRVLSETAQDTAAAMN